MFVIANAYMVLGPFKSKQAAEAYLKKSGCKEVGERGWWYRIPKRGYRFDDKIAEMQYALDYGMRIQGVRLPDRIIA